MSGTQQNLVVIPNDLEYNPAVIYDYEEYKYNRWEDSSTTSLRSPSPTSAPPPSSTSNSTWGPNPYDDWWDYEPRPESPPCSLDLEPWGTPPPDTLEPASPTPSASPELVFREEADVIARALIPRRPSTPILDFARRASGILGRCPAIDFALEPSLWQPRGSSLVRVRVDLYITRREAVLLFLALWILSRYL